MQRRWSDFYAMIFLGYLVDLTSNQLGKLLATIMIAVSHKNGIRWVTFASSYGGNIAPNPAKGAYDLAGVPSVVGSGRPAGKVREVRIVRTGSGRAAGVLRTSDTMNCSPPVHQWEFSLPPLPMHRC